jgi:phosphohistidine swiveling domain-containing protein
MEKLVKILVRPADVATLVDYGLAIGQDSYDKAGAGFLSVVFLLKHGGMTEYRSEKEEENLKKVFRDLFFNRYQKIQSLIRQFVRDYNRLMEIVKQSNNIKNHSPAEVIKLIKEFIKYYHAVWPAVMVIYWIPYWAEMGEFSKNFSEEDKKKINYMLDVRHKHDREYVSAMFFYDNVYEYIKNKFSVNNNLRVLTPEELISILKERKISEELKKKIEKRTDKCLVFRDQIFPYKNRAEINDFLKKYNYQIVEEKENVARVDVLKGKVAYAGGLIKDKVKLLFSRDDMAKVESGDIIVSPMTTPYFNPVLKKAAAIVTDEGGITCHAAIVAREMKKPCVIGTKIATKVLKDGDLVEVDAEKGIVRKIK